MKTLYVAAEAREFDGFVADSARRSPVFRAEVEQGTLLANGPGARRAEAATRAELRESRYSSVVSTGYCGALNPMLRLSEIFITREIVEESTGERFACAIPQGSSVTGRLLSTDRVVASAKERAHLHAQGFDAVEMEAAGVARAARDAGLPLYAIRVVSDDGSEDWSIDFNRARGSDGRFRTWHILAQALVRPWRGIPELRRLQRTSAQCSRMLATYLQQVTL